MIYSKSTLVMMGVFWVTSIIILVATIVYASTAWAQVADPDTISIDRVEAYESVIENTDQLYVISYTLDYTVNPSDGIDDNYLFRLLASSGSEIMSAVAYPYYESGYDEGVVGIYFSATDVSALSLSFGDTTGYTIQLVGNPLVTWASGTPPETNKATFDLWYDDPGASSRLALRMRVIANSLENTWSGVDLIEGAAGERTLTADGEEYFTNSIPNLKMACPDIFGARQVDAVWGRTPHLMDYFTTGASTGTTTYSGYGLGQVFEATRQYRADGVAVYISRTGTPTVDATVNLCLSDPAGYVGTPVATGTITVADVAQTIPEWHKVNWGEGYTVVRGTDYAVTLTLNGGSPTACLNWIYDSGYADGYAVHQAGTTSWSLFGTNDFAFIIRSADAFEMQYSKELEDRLVGTIFDVEDAAEDLGISRMWLSSLLWIMLEVAFVVIISTRANSAKPVMALVFIMTPIGALAGFVYLWAAAGLTFVAALMFVYALAWERTT